MPAGAHLRVLKVASTGRRSMARNPADLLKKKPGRFQAERDGETVRAMGESFVRAEARSILSKNRIELALLRVGVFGNAIRLQGVLRRVAGLPELTHEALEGLEREMRRIPGVRRVEMLLSNWQRKDSEWMSTETEELETVALDPLAPPTESTCWTLMDGPERRV